MKKTLLLVAMATSVLSASAQLTLPATSPYTQDFDGLPAYPTGWSTYNNATSTSLGTIEAIQYMGQSYPSVLRPDTCCIGTVNVGGFKNFPSGDVCHMGDDYCGAPTPIPCTPTSAPSYTDRALGIRQVDPSNGTHPNLDPGAAVVLKIANTTGHGSFAFTFKLQSLDTASGRTTNWSFDYGIAPTASGVPTAFTPITPTSGSMATGAHAFTNTTIVGNFGTALDNKSTPVYIRVVALSGSGGSGARASTAIDDFTLTYNNAPNAVVNTIEGSNISLTVLGTATSDKITFGCATETAGKYNFAIYDFTGRMIHTETVNTVAGTQSFSVNGLNMAPGMYIAKMFNENTSSVVKVAVQ